MRRHAGTSLRKMSVIVVLLQPKLSWVHKSQECVLKWATATSFPSIFLPGKILYLYHIYTQYFSQVAGLVLAGLRHDLILGYVVLIKMLDFMEDLYVWSLHKCVRVYRIGREMCLEF
jgi:hypothetical protein